MNVFNLYQLSWVVAHPNRCRDSIWLVYNYRKLESFTSKSAVKERTSPARVSLLLRPWLEITCNCRRVEHTYFLEKYDICKQEPDLCIYSDILHNEKGELLLYESGLHRHRSPHTPVCNSCQTSELAHSICTRCWHPPPSNSRSAFPGYLSNWGLVRGRRVLQTELL